MKNLKTVETRSLKKDIYSDDEDKRNSERKRAEKIKKIKKRIKVNYDEEGIEYY